ncbi:PLP-dependent transferase [Streptomyces celluloflavus]|uniref:PLP-dependent transferase n=1 Tax=Streptomyces celluloflavus TaxID=58344 RepID=A0ABW7RE04_9ACTN|nr:PLP-dependent transferase [Streptomyces celluloflavus]
MPRTSDECTGRRPAATLGPGGPRAHHPVPATGRQQITHAQLRGGGMLSAALDAAAARTATTGNRLVPFAITPGRGGGVEPLISRPVATTHHGLDPAERTERGIADGVIRCRPASKRRRPDRRPFPQP